MINPEQEALTSFIHGLARRLARQDGHDSHLRHLVLNEWNKRENPNAVSSPASHQAANQMLETAIMLAPVFRERYSYYYQMYLALEQEQKFYGHWPTSEILTEGLNAGSVAYLATHNIAITTVCAILGLVSTAARLAATPLFKTVSTVDLQKRHYLHAMETELWYFATNLTRTYQTTKQGITSSQPQSS